MRDALHALMRAGRWWDYWVGSEIRRLARWLQDDWRRPVCLLAAEVWFIALIEWRT